MPETRIVFFQDDNGKVPVLSWLSTLQQQDRKGYANCIARIQQLAESGYELRRPAADFLRNGVYELRAKHVRVQYRILYFFHGQNVVVLAHAIVKEEDRVPDIDIDRAIAQRELFTTSPETYTYLEPEEAENEEN
jgi:phage-related protein